VAGWGEYGLLNEKLEVWGRVWGSEWQVLLGEGLLVGMGGQGSRAGAGFCWVPEGQVGRFVYGTLCLAQGFW